MMVASVLLAGGLLAELSRNESSPESPHPARSRPLMIYCAASNRSVIEAIARDYERSRHQAVQLQFGPSQALLSALEISGTGDLYLPADEDYLDTARDRGLVTASLDVATMRVGLAVRRGNPKGVWTFEDLLRADVRVVQADAESAAIGRITRDVLRRSRQWEALDAATVAYRTSVADAANDVVLGAANVAIVYDAFLNTYPRLEFVAMEPLSNAHAQIAVGVLASSPQPAAALDLARFIADPNRGGRVYRENGFMPPSRDANLSGQGAPDQRPLAGESP